MVAKTHPEYCCKYCAIICVYYLFQYRWWFTFIRYWGDVNKKIKNSCSPTLIRQTCYKTFVKYWWYKWSTLVLSKCRCSRDRNRWLHKTSNPNRTIFNNINISWTLENNILYILEEFIFYRWRVIRRSRVSGLYVYIWFVSYILWFMYLTQ